MNDKTISVNTSIEDFDIQKQTLEKRKNETNITKCNSFYSPNDVLE